MIQNEVKQAARAQYAERFGRDPDVVAFAPGRVNLLGEHTDYNGGLVLPVPLQMGTAIALGRGSGDGLVRIVSGHAQDIASRQISDAATGHWSDYALGALAFSENSAQQGFDVSISTSLPVGSGLSSSAALIVGTLRAVAALSETTVHPVDVAKLARRVENEFVGLPCGIMDQFAVSVGEPRHALFLDTSSLQYRTIALPTSHSFVVVHCGSGHKLTDDGYASRVRECQAACKVLDTKTLSDLTPDDLTRVNALEAPLAARARHIVTENARVGDAVAALAAGDMAGLAAAMNASHASQRDDYEVSIPEIDLLVEAALTHGAVGARLTGGGFGGSIVALVEASMIDDWSRKVSESRPQARILSIV